MKSQLEGNQASQTHSVETLRKILERQQKRRVSTAEAEVTGESLIEFFEALIHPIDTAEANNDD